MKKKYVIIPFLLLLLSSLFCLSVMAEEEGGFNAALSVDRTNEAAGSFTVTVQHSDVLVEKEPTLRLPCVYTSAIIIGPDGVSEQIGVMADGTVSFTVAAGGTYIVKNGAECEHDFGTDGECACGMLNVTFVGATLSLGDRIGVHFYMAIPDAIAEDENSSMRFTLVDGTTAVIPVKNAAKEIIGGNALYKFTCSVNAKEMTDTLRAQIIRGESKSEEYTYSVRRYADLMFANSSAYSAETLALVKALLHYGAYAQTFLAYNTDNLADKDMEPADLSDVTAEMLKEHTARNVTLEGYGTFIGSSLSLRTKTVLLAYFDLAEGVDIGELRFTANGKTVSPVLVDEANGYYTLSMENIAASDLDTKYTFTVEVLDDSNKSASASCSSLSYCYSVLVSDAYSEDLENLVKAIYLYNQAANAYEETQSN